MSAIKEHYHDQIEAEQRGLHKIGWLNMPGFKPETWNPIVGCTKVSPGCDNCYAEKFAFRLVNMLEKNKGETYHVYQNAANKNGWTGRTALNTDHINLPLKWKTSRMIFVCSMGDLFHENVPFTWLDQVFEVILDCSEHIFIILTKRPERMKQYIDYRIETGKYYRHSWVWLGVTAENQEQANKRIPILLQIPAAKRIVSIEPMLSPINFDIEVDSAYYRGYTHRNLLTGIFSNQILHSHCTTPGEKLDWVICGGESGSKARPMHPDWVRSVRDQCKDAGTPFFFKQWGEWLPVMEVPEEWGHPADIVCKHSWVDKADGRNTGQGEGQQTLKVGRKAAGNLLDGQQHHEWPKINL